MNAREKVRFSWEALGVISSSQDLLQRSRRLKKLPGPHGRVGAVDFCFFQRVLGCWENDVICKGFQEVDGLIF